MLPVWLLLCPRDYLSSYLKIGTILLLVVGVVIVNPPIQMPGVTEFVHGGGPIIKGPLFPFVFITIACGAISGFHALVPSGTTPKMIDKESHCRPIGYGSMLMEGLVGITALIAACVMPPEDYVAINTDPKIALVASESTNQAGLARLRKSSGAPTRRCRRTTASAAGSRAGSVDHRAVGREAARLEAARAVASAVG